MPEESTGGSDMSGVIAAINALTSVIENTQIPLLIAMEDHLAVMRAASGGGGYATTLMQEYMNRNDLDNNGSIYGVDFIITDPPAMLKGLEITILENAEGDLPEWTEDQYFESLE